jgi:hypothetical protein
VSAAGNEGDRRRHARKSVPAGGAYAFHLDVGEITFPIGDPLTHDDIDDRVHTPPPSHPARLTTVRHHRKWARATDWTHPAGVLGRQLVRPRGKAAGRCRRALSGLVCGCPYRPRHAVQ